ncbi:hypothetical protein WQG_1980 [Bibersteinia trehalosi USDA-ARS-USMARC-192]|nr:hypothetical protein WQG_1980 [Bibersteinia trehalosi USDA-ARS-USMARC-192]
MFHVFSFCKILLKNNRLKPETIGVQQPLTSGYFIVIFC